MTSDYEKNHGCASRHMPDGVLVTVTAHRCETSDTWSYAAWDKMPTKGPGVAVEVEPRFADRMGYGFRSKAEALDAGFASLHPT
jgi:hypothetical protein